MVFLASYLSLCYNIDKFHMLSPPFRETDKGDNRYGANDDTG